MRPRLRLHHQVQVHLHHCRQPQLQGRRHLGRSDQGQLHRLCRHQKQLQQLKIPKSLEMKGKLKQILNSYVPICVEDASSQQARSYNPPRSLPADF